MRYVKYPKPFKRPGSLKRISHLMVEREIGSNAELARRAGMNENTVAGWFKDRRKRFPVADDLVLVAQALGTRVEFLVTGQDPVPAKIPEEAEDLLKVVSAFRGDDLKLVYLSRIRSYADAVVEEARHRREERDRLPFPDRRKVAGK